MPETRAELAYLRLKTAQKLYGKAPVELAGGEHERVARLAERQHDLEARVLRAPEARDVVVPEASVTAALDEIRRRYAHEDEFLADLARNGLDAAGFAAAVARELKVEAVLDRVGARAAEVSDIDIELYHHYHPEQFRRAETRRARHILITINDAIAENRRDAARARIDAIAARLAKNPGRFAEQALKHSECPSALQGGQLGELPRGKLYAELDVALFELPAGGISGVLESPLGFHLLLCEAITPAGVLSRRQAREPIRELLTRRRRQVCQRAWLKQLGG
jgi:nitrogen fixation protein NifM